MITRLVGYIIFIGLVSGNSVELLRKIRPAYSIAYNSNLLQNSSECRKELKNFRQAVDNRMLWAIKTLDANGEPKNGFIYGNNYWLGIKSQCFDAANHQPLELAPEFLQNNSKYRPIEEEFPPFELNYFGANFYHNSTAQYHLRMPNEDIIYLGLCLPASCTANELALIIRHIFSEKTLLVGDIFSAEFNLISVRNLKTNYEWLINWRIITVGLILMLSVLLIIVGTSYDMLVHQKRLKMTRRFQGRHHNSLIVSTITDHHQELANKSFLIEHPSMLGKIVMCWSVYTNSKSIFDTNSSDSIAPIHGLRFLGMVWIIMIHTVLYMLDYTDNRVMSWRISQGVFAAIISNGSLSVDTYFHTAGFLLAWNFFKDRNKKRDEMKVITQIRWGDFFTFLLTRIIRLTPAYMITVGIVEAHFTWYAQTSMIINHEKPEYNCAHYWWRNLLYINNFFSRESMCMSWSWYLSNDMQFFIVGAFLLILSDVYFYTSAALLAIVLALSLAISGYISYLYEYTPTFDNLWNTLSVIYDRPWMRIGPYLIGMITAYILMKLNNKLILKKKTLWLLWILGSCCNIFVLFGLFDRNISIVSTAVYVALGRTVWSIGIAWLLIGCITNNAGFINKILSFKAWIPLSKLTYCAYLLNPLLLYSMYINADTSMHIDVLPNIALFLGNISITYIFSYIACLIIEAPFIRLLKILRQYK